MNGDENQAIVSAATLVLDGRLPSETVHPVVAACEEYRLAEDELPDEFDTEDYRLSNAVGSLVRQRNDMQAKCAEMQGVLLAIWRDIQQHKEYPPKEVMGPMIAHALSTDCGKHFYSPKERLEIQCCAEQALVHLGDSGNGSRHDPSWIRPMKMSREEITASCIQAYHQIHRILEILGAHKTP